MSVTDKELLRDNLKHLMTTGVVQCIVGTYDPGMFAIPFLPSVKYSEPEKRVFQDCSDWKKRQKQR